LRRYPVSTLFIAYDLGTGRIVAVHRGPAHIDSTWVPNIDQAENVAVIRGTFPECEHGKRYKVDVASKKLVETNGEDGVSFGAGKIG
jgi:hypothetical protein